jgi:hypothetical protein
VRVGRPHRGDLRFIERVTADRGARGRGKKRGARHARGEARRVPRAPATARFELPTHHFAQSSSHAFDFAHTKSWFAIPAPSDSAL